MKTSLRGLAEIAGHEGIVPYPYRDSVGVWTFGVGHTASAGVPNPATMKKGEARPLREVMELFAKDIAKYERRVNAAVKVPITQSEFDALVSFDFNTGGIHQARLTKLLNEGKRPEAAAAFDGWHRPPEIIPRRNKEKALFAHGSYSGGGMASVYPADANGRVKWSKGERVNVLSLLQPRQPDDPGPEPDLDISTDRIPSYVGEGAAEARGNPFAVTGGLIAGAALYAFRRPIGKLFHMAFREDGTTRAVGIALLFALVAGITALVLWAL